MFTVILVVFAICAGTVPAMDADYKGHNFFLWWLFGAVLLPVAAPMAARLRPTAESLRVQAELQRYVQAVCECPSCHRDVMRHLATCRHCGRDLTPSRTTLSAR